MVIFHSYVKLPEGIMVDHVLFIKQSFAAGVRPPWRPQFLSQAMSSIPMVADYHPMFDEF